MADNKQRSVYGTFADHISYARLKDVCEPKIGVQTGPFGTQLHQGDYVTDGTPIITVEHLGENRVVHENLPLVSDDDKVKLARYSLREGDIVFSRVGSVDRRALVRAEEDGWLFSSRCLRVRPNREQICPVYLSYFFGLPAFKEYIRSIAVGATMPSINTHILSNIPVYFPDLEAQRAIANVLSSLDAKINLNRQINQTLEQMAQAVFQAWFVDFEPVKAKVAARTEGRDPVRAAMSTLSGKTDDELDEMPREAFDALAATAALFPEEMEESALGAIPKGWKVSTVEELSSKVGMGPFGSNIKVSTFVETGIPVISGPHVKSLQLQDGETKFVSVQHADRLASANVQRGDVIFTHAGNISNVSYIPDGSRYERYILSQRQFFLRVDSHKISPIYIVYFFNSPEGQHKLLANSSSSGVPSIARPVSYLKSITLPTPTKAIFCLFDTVIRHYHRMIMNKRQETETLESLRDSLLPKLLSGELAVTPEEAEP